MPKFFVPITAPDGQSGDAAEVIADSRSAAVSQVEKVIADETDDRAWDGFVVDVSGIQAIGMDETRGGVDLTT